jgi:four helix bundle protein
MAGVRVFTDLLFWQKARQLSKLIFQETRKPPFSGDRRLVEQINDSSASVMATSRRGSVAARRESS